MTRDLKSLGQDEGFGLLEVLVSLALVALVTMGIALNLVTSLRIGKHTEAHFAASTLASSRVEELMAIDAIELDESLDETDTIVNFPGLEIDFLRSTTVVVNADFSRTLQVTVSSAHDALSTSVAFETTLARWE